MKNLKRLLSLALTGVMLSGMMVMGASAADFTDADEIVNTEAVDTMVSLNIINGKDNGTFDPEGLVTRAEMAKMIATAVNGGIAPEFGVKSTPTYTDIKGHWAEQFIEYCSDMKYINGRGNGTFDPEGKVTGTEAAKMVLSALGYDARAYQLTGADWAINTNALAGRDTKPTLYEDLQGTNMNAPVSRDVAARIIWNGLQNYIVEYNPNVTITGTDITYGYQKSKTTTLLKQAYDADITIAQFVGNEKFGDHGAKKGQISVVPASYNEKTGAIEFGTNYKNVPSDLSIDYIGEIVKVIWKDEKNTAKGMDSKDTIYGVFPTGETEVVRATMADVQDNKVANEAKIKIDGTKYDLRAYENSKGGVNVYTNYKATPAVYGKAAGDLFKTTDDNSQLTTDLKKVNGNTIKLVINDGEVTDIYVTTSDLAVVLAKNSEKITLNNNFGSFKIDDNDVYEDIKKGDVVVATRLYNDDADKGYTIVEKAEVVTGEVSKYKTTTKDKVTTYNTVTVDGETYKIYNEVKLFNSGLGSDAVQEFKDKIGEEFDLYLVKGFARAAVQTSESASNWSVVLEAKDGTDGSVFTDLELYVMNAEGTKTRIKVSADTSKKLIRGDDKDTSSLKKADFPIGSLITYSVNRDDEAVIKNFKKYEAGAGHAYNKDTKTFNNITTSADCVVFVNTKDASAIGSATVAGDTTMKAYKIRDLGNLAAKDDKDTVISSIYITNTEGDRVLAVVVDLQKSPVGSSSTRVYGIITNSGETVKKDGEKTLYTASVNGENYDLYLTNGTLAKGDIVSFEPVNDSIYADVNNKVVDGENKITKIDVTQAGVDLGWVREYSEDDGTLLMWTSLQGKDKNNADTSTGKDIASYEGKGSKTYAVNKDTKFYFVDQKNDKGVDAGSITEFDPIKGYTNVIVVWHQEDKSGTVFADAIIFETSGDADLVKPVAGRVDKK